MKSVEWEQTIFEHKPVVESRGRWNSYPHSVNCDSNAISALHADEAMCFPPSPAAPVLHNFSGGSLH